MSNNWSPAYEHHGFDLAKLAEDAFTDEEARVLLDFLVQYLDWLIHRGRPEQLDCKQTHAADACLCATYFSQES